LGFGLDTCSVGCPLGPTDTLALAPCACIASLLNTRMCTTPCAVASLSTKASRSASTEATSPRPSFSPVPKLSVPLVSTRGCRGGRMGRRR
jgi:hypothetical protein